MPTKGKKVDVILTRLQSDCIDSCIAIVESESEYTGAMPEALRQRALDIGPERWSREVCRLTKKSIVRRLKSLKESNRRP